MTLTCSIQVLTSTKQTLLPFIPRHRVRCLSIEIRMGKCQTRIISLDKLTFKDRFTISTDCDARNNFNQGCGVQFAKPSSYGNAFNAQGGGWFVMVRTRQDGVRIWFWSRNDPNVPPEIRDMPQRGLLGGPPDISPDPSWGNPEASFPLSDNCDYDSHFDAHSMVFDLTFCVSIRPPRSVIVQVADSTYIRAIGRVPTTLIRAVGVTATTASFSTNSNK